MFLAFAAFQPWLVAGSLLVTAAGLGACWFVVAYLRRGGSHHVTTLLILAIVAIMGIAAGLAGVYGTLYGLDLGDSIGR